jgi:hypothetical protein
VKLGQRCLAVAALAAVLAFPLRADAPACPAIDPPTVAPQKALPSEALAKEGSLRAFRDPVTGELRKPTREEAAAAAKTQAQAAPERQPVFEVVVHPDGMKTVDLQGAFMAAAVATRNPDGSITVRCVPAGTRATAPVPPPARPALEEK